MVKTEIDEQPDMADCPIWPEGGTVLREYGVSP